MQPPTYPPDPSNPVDPLNYWNSPNAMPPMRLDRSWWEIWKRVFFSPSLNTYWDLLQEPNKSLNRSLKWIGILWLVGLGLQILFTLILGAAFDTNEFQTTNLGNTRTTTNTEFNNPLSSVFFIVICGPFAIAFGFVVYLIFYCSVPHVAALVLGGTGTFEGVVFLYSAIYAMMTVITSATTIVGGGIILLLVAGGLSAIFIIMYVLLLLFLLAITLYVLILQIIALNAAHRIGWIKATISALALYILVFGCYCGCFGLLLLSGGSSS